MGLEHDLDFGDSQLCRAIEASSVEASGKNAPVEHPIRRDMVMVSSFERARGE